MASISILDRFLKFVSPCPFSGCWLWLGYTLKGHSRFGIGSKVYYGHRVSYELFRGPIPETDEAGNALELDHLCRVRCCVNPWHLEAVTGFENYRRGNGAEMTIARQTALDMLIARNACRRGHPLTPDNVLMISGERTCRTCRNNWQNEHRRLFGRKG